MTVFGAAVFKPGSIETHEIAKSPGVGIPRMLNERGKAGGQSLGQTFFAWIVEDTGEQQGARIVVHTIAVRAIRYRMRRVLEQAGIVAHGRKWPNCMSDAAGRGAIATGPVRAITFSQSPWRAFSNAAM